MTTRSITSSAFLPRAIWDADSKYGELHFDNGVYFIDIDDFNIISLIMRKFHSDNSCTYPYYFDTNNKKISILARLFNYCPLTHKYVFLNGNTHDLRHENVIVYHIKHEEILALHPEAKHIGGHFTKRGKNSYLMQNPIWEFNEDGGKTYIMFACPDKFTYICEEGMNRIRLFEEKFNSGNPITWSCMNEFHLCGSVRITNIESKLYCMHQIIMDFYGHGKGSMGLSIDHIDRDPLNNRMDNLRIADRKMQEQNSKGIAPGTKRERQSIARPLPEGITQDMMRKYVIYYLNTYNKEKGLTREYFTVENPLLEKTWESSKSKEVSIMDKLAAANKVAADLEKGIFPTKAEKPLPKYFRYGIRNGNPSIVFERRTADTRCAMDYSIPEDEDIAVSLGKMREKIIAKYGDNVC